MPWSQSTTATGERSRGSRIMLFSLKSLCSSAGAPSGTRCRSSQSPSSACSASVPSSSAASPRLRQPLTARARNPAGRPRSSRPTASASTAWIAASVSSSTCDSRAPTSGRPASSGGMCSRITRPGRYSMIWNCAPMTLASAAQEQPARHERQRIGQPAQDAELARHVVGAGWKLAERRSAQHGRPAVEMDQVVEVRQAAGELPRRRIVVEPQPVAAPDTRARRPNRAERSGPPNAHRPAVAAPSLRVAALAGERVLRFDPAEHAAPGRLAQQPVRVRRYSDVCGYSRVARRCGAAAGAFALLGAAVDLVLLGAMPPSRPMLTR